MSAPVPALFGARVCHERKARGLTIARLSEASGVLPGAISRTERAVHGYVSLTAAVRLAEALSMSLEALVAAPACPQCWDIPRKGTRCGGCGLEEVPPACRNEACGQPLRLRAGQRGWDGARGYCGPCYRRWGDISFAGSRPPDPLPPRQRGSAARERSSRERAQRVERFAAYLAKGYPIRLAADRVGVSLETGYVYSGELKRRQRQGVAA